MRSCSLFLLAVVAGCSQRSDPPATDHAPAPPAVTPSAPPVASAPPPSKAEVGAAKILSEPALAGVVGMLRPAFKDRQGENDPATDILVAWARRHGVDQGQLAAMPATTPEAFAKNPAAERGKRLCVSGTIFEIRASGDTRIVRLLTDTKDVVTALTVGDTTGLAEDRKARFCGVATGLFTYKTGEGEAVESVRAVGSFDPPGGGSKPVASAH